MVQFLTYTYLHDIVLFSIYLGFNLAILGISYANWKHWKLAKIYHLKNVYILFTGLLIMNIVFFVRGISRMLTAQEYYHFGSVLVKSVLINYGHLTLHLIVFTTWIWLNFLLFKYLNKI